MVGVIRHRTVAALLAMMLATTVVGGLLNSPPVSAAAADPAPPDSAVTVSGRGDFANLKVTVSQTKNLINQTVRVSWTGGTPTPSTGFTLNFLQIMQCWGDDPAGPDRTQCQFGGLTALGSATTVGPFVLSRQIEDGDPEETLKQPAGSSSQVYVPFWAVGTDKPTGSGTGNTNDFFDSQVTNEIPLARTHGDGTGEEFFEVETVRQAAGLGCGEPVVTSGVHHRAQLLAGDRAAGQQGSERFNSHRRQRPSLLPGDLAAEPVQLGPTGSWSHWGSSRLVKPARSGRRSGRCSATSWRSRRSARGSRRCARAAAPCSATPSSPTMWPAARRDGTLALVTNPVPPDQAPTDHPLVYAPVGLSGLTFAFNIDHQPSPITPPLTT